MYKFICQESSTCFGLLVRAYFGSIFLSHRSVWYQEPKSISDRTIFRWMLRHYEIKLEVAEIGLVNNTNSVMIQSICLCGHLGEIVCVDMEWGRKSTKRNSMAWQPKFALWRFPAATNPYRTQNINVRGKCATLRVEKLQFTYFLEIPVNLIHVVLSVFITRIFPHAIQKVLRSRRKTRMCIQYPHTHRVPKIGTVWLCDVKIWKIFHYSNWIHPRYFGTIRRHRITSKAEGGGEA